MIANQQFTKAVAITTSDTVNFTAAGTGPPSDITCDAIYVGGAGNMVVVLADGTAVTFNGVAAGSIIPIRAIRVNATNTTATNLVALYAV